MRSIAIFNNKGGVGKTTLLCNLASYLALEKNKKVLVVDSDPQCNATQNFFADEMLDELYSGSKNKQTIYSIIHPISVGKGYAEHIKPYSAKHFGIDLIPGDPRLSLKEDLLAKDWGDALGGSVRGLRTTFLFAQLLQRFQNYDYVFFDMGPSLGSINRAVLVSADYFLTPMSLDIFSIRAIENISISLENWKKQLHTALSNSDDLEELEGISTEWKLKFIGYVTQQYTAKVDSEGRRRPVKAFDRIMKNVPKTIEQHFIEKLQPASRNVSYDLGSIPTLHSLIPLSQTNRKPIFDLRSSDGVVGAHFAKVREYRRIIGGISDRMEINIGALG